MPICERDPWRLQFFEGVACPETVRVPTDDIDCYAWFSDFNWVYQKQRIAASQGLDCGDHTKVPRQFPVFAKPNVNLRGMGLDTQRIDSPAAFHRHMREGMMWMPLLVGEHVSTDAAVVDGRCVWMRHALGETWTDGMFKHWTIECAGRPALTRQLEIWILTFMRGYSGMMNIETIGGKIIEAHLRFADQWCDLYGAGWMDALVGLYADGRWSLPAPAWKTGYSVPLFTRHGMVPQHPLPEAEAAIRAMPDVSSLQITFHPAKPGQSHPMPPGGFRLGIINSWTLEAGFAARRALASCFPGCDIMLPE